MSIDYGIVQNQRIPISHGALEMDVSEQCHADSQTIGGGEMGNEPPSADEPFLKLPGEDQKSALTGLSVEHRIILARKPWVEGDSGNLRDADVLAHKLILQNIVRDSEARVRQALAETLAENPAAPRDVVLALAADVDLVASPVLALSDILTPVDLVGIINTEVSSQKMAAIATRGRFPRQFASR